MCLIINKPAGRRITADFLEHAWEHNSHGWGCFYTAEGQVRWTRGMQFHELLDVNRRLPHDTEVYLHVRKATYGAICADMAHPYVVRDGLMLMHNGSIHHLAPKDPSVSDSAELARLLRDLFRGLSDAQVSEVIRSEGFARLTSPLIDGSVVVLHDARGAVRLGRTWHVVQPQDWHAEMTGIEVSNTHAWKPGSRLAAAA